jgi:hypothetical protein
MISLLRRFLVGVAAVVLFAMAFVPRAAHLPLDPDEPIAADGSMIAGRAQTIYDTNALLGVFGPVSCPDPDDPKEFEWLIENDRRAAESARRSLATLIRPVGALHCDNANRNQLIAAVRFYYRTRGGEIHSFSLRGPRARAAIEREWSTPVDHQINEFVRRALESGFLHKDEIPANVYPEFAELFADTQEIGAACPLSLKADRSLEGLLDVHPRPSPQEASYATPPKTGSPSAASPHP